MFNQNSLMFLKKIYSVKINVNLLVMWPFLGVLNKLFMSTFQLHGFVWCFCVLHTKNTLMEHFTVPKPFEMSVPAFKKNSINVILCYICRESALG